MNLTDDFELKFTSREVTAWSGLALLKRLLDGLDFKARSAKLATAAAWLQSGLPTRTTHRTNDR